MRRTVCLSHHQKLTKSASILRCDSALLAKFDERVKKVKDELRDEKEEARLEAAKQYQRKYGVEVPTMKTINALGLEPSTTRSIPLQPLSSQPQRPTDEARPEPMIGVRQLSTTLSAAEPGTQQFHQRREERVDEDRPFALALRLDRFRDEVYIKVSDPGEWEDPSEPIFIMQAHRDIMY